MYLWSVSLVYQLSGQFLIFLVNQKQIWYTKKKFGRPKKYLVYQKKFGIPKKNLVDQKKGEIDRTIGTPKRLTKSTWTPLDSSPVHVVLVSLLVDQLCGLFLTFFGRPKKICSVLGNFWSVSEFFLIRL